MKRRWGKVTAIFLTILMAAGLSACGASKQQTKGEKEETEVQKRAELTVLAAASMTDAKIEEKVDVVCEAPEGSCEPVIYPAGVVSASEQKEEAKDFLEFLKTEQVSEILKGYGFTPYEE